MRSIQYLAALAVLLLTGSLAAFRCNAQKIYYFDGAGRPVKEKKARFMQVQTKVNDTTWEFNTYRINGPRVVSLQYRDEKGLVLNGLYINYDRMGNCDSTGGYVSGRKQGQWDIYAPNGRLLKSLHVRTDTLVGEKDSTQINNERKLADDSLHAVRTVVEIESAFAGGARGWLRYLNQNLRYPDDAVERKIQGTPLIGFIVAADGHIDQNRIVVFNSAEYSLDKEALRIIRLSPPWTPAVQDGRKVRSYKKQPIIFHF